MSSVLITGSNRGIGLEFARQYAANGDSVIATCRQPNAAKDLACLAKEHSNVAVLPLDVASDDSIAALEDELRRKKIVIDTLVSNAGVLHNEEFGEWTRKQFSDTMEINAIGPALLTQSLEPLLTKEARMIQLSSGLGSLEWGGEGMSDGDAYAVSKAALNMVTVRLASVFRGGSRCIVSMSPGWVATDMGGSSAPLSVEDSVSKMRATIRTLTPKDSGRFIDNEGNSIPW